MNLSDYLSEQCMIVDSGVTDKEGLLQLVAETACKSPILQAFSDADIYKKLAEREALGSTGFGNKIAIPHCTLDGISDFVIGMITHKNGIDFDSLDGEKSNLFVFIIAPSDKRNEHIRNLSAISSVLRISKAVEEIIASREPADARERFLHYLPEREIRETRKDYNLIHIFIQSEEKFEDLMSILMEIDTAGISIMEADNAEKYLYHLPLFSSFWSEKKQGFQRIVILTVERSITNDVLRKINLLIDSLPNKTGIMVLMQNMVFCNGSLEI